jgi:hypothetical protein
MLGQPVTQELRVHQIPSRGVVPLELVHIFVAGLLPPLMCGRSSDSSHIKFEVLWQMHVQTSLDGLSCSGRPCRLNSLCE